MRRGRVIAVFVGVLVGVALAAALPGDAGQRRLSLAVSTSEGTYDVGQKPLITATVRSLEDEGITVSSPPNWLKVKRLTRDGRRVKPFRARVAIYGQPHVPYLNGRSLMSGESDTFPLQVFDDPDVGMYLSVLKETKKGFVEFAYPIGGAGHYGLVLRVSWLVTLSDGRTVKQTTVSDEAFFTIR